MFLFKFVLKIPACAAYLGQIKVQNVLITEEGDSGKMNGVHLTWIGSKFTFKKSLEISEGIFMKNSFKLLTNEPRLIYDHRMPNYLSVIV